MKPAVKRIWTCLTGWLLLSLTAQRRTQTNRVNGRKEIIKMQSMRTRRAAERFFMNASSNLNPNPNISLRASRRNCARLREHKRLLVPLNSLS